MAIGSGLFVNRALQVEHGDDASRTKVEVLFDEFDDLFVRDFARTEGFDVDGNRAGYADGISQLDFAFIGGPAATTFLAT